VLVARQDTERPGARWWLPEDTSLGNLRAAVEGCQGCELYAEATHGVMGDGPEDAGLMVVGEQPGDEDDLAGEPFVGPAGLLLDDALNEAGIDPAEVFRTNVVKHFRVSGTRGSQRFHKAPGRVHVAACLPWLVAELDLVRPAGVVLLGGTAGQAVFGASYRVGEGRGRLEVWPEVLGGQPASVHRPGWVVTTTHPAAVLRSPRRAEDFGALVADLSVAAEALARLAD
jgi:uracil-DNA glycosylase